MNQFVQLASLLEKGYPLAHSLLIVDENLQPIVDQLEQLSLIHIYHPRLEQLPKILETPYVDDQPPYKEEIKMLKQGVFDSRLLNKQQG